MLLSKVKTYSRGQAGNNKDILQVQVGNSVDQNVLIYDWCVCCMC